MYVNLFLSDHDLVRIDEVSFKILLIVYKAHDGIRIGGLKKVSSTFWSL